MNLPHSASAQYTAQSPKGMIFTRAIPKPWNDARMANTGIIH
jgi:hypothetical protein